MTDLQRDAMLIRIGIGVLGLVISFFPGSPIAKVLFAGRGPVPQDGESLHRFSLRQSLFFFSWALALGALAALASAVLEHDPTGENVAPLAATMICGIVALVMLAGCAGHAIRAGWEYAFRREQKYRVFSAVPPPP